jgi:Ras-related protein Rab-1A
MGCGNSAESEATDGGNADGLSVGTPRRDAIKLLLLGDSAVGKSSLMFRFVEKKHLGEMMATIGIDFKWTTVLYKDVSYRVQIWDTAGQEKFRTIGRSYYRGIKVFILVYDITNRESYEHIEYWIEELSRDGTDAYKMIVGNKSDLEDQRVVSTKEAKEFARTQNSGFMEASSKDGTNVDTIFHLAVAEYVKNMK